MLLSPSDGVDLDVVCDEGREAPDSHIGEGGLDKDGGRSLGELHGLDVHGLGRRQPQSREASAHQGAEVFQGLGIVIITLAY